jgi:hypothetical protein
MYNERAFTRLLASYAVSAALAYKTSSGNQFWQAYPLPRELIWEVDVQRTFWTEKSTEALTSHLLHRQT